MFDNTPVGFGAEASASVLRAPQNTRGRFGIGGQFSFRVLGPDGRPYRDGILIAKNMVPNAALDDVLNKYLRNGTTASAWYMSLIDNSGFSTLAAADTMASHGGWSEFTTWSGSTRPTWSPAAASSQVVVNGSTVNFSITGTATIKGAFITTANDKGGATGTLFATAAFSGGNLSVANGDTVQVTYSCTASAT